MTFFAELLDKGPVANCLFGSLQVDSSKVRYLLGWQPLMTTDELLNKMLKVNEKSFDFLLVIFLV
jgi:hypothetical protein